MSNPGVINLFSFFKRSGTIKRFQIEDNIGESIHIHVNNFRIDLTIKEFYTLVDSLRESCKELQKPIDMLKEYSIDPLFFNLLAPNLKDLKSTKVKKIKIRDLKFLVRKKYSSFPELLFPKRIDKTFIFRSLKGKKNIENYNQINYPGIKNIDRINMLKKNLTMASYIDSNSCVICFNDQLYVRDGQHRCAVLAEKYGLNTEVDVLFLNFNGKYNFYPLLFYFKFIIKIFTKFLKVIYYRITKK